MTDVRSVRQIRVDALGFARDEHGCGPVRELQALHVVQHEADTFIVEKSGA